MEHPGKLIEETRKQRGLSQPDLASQVGISQAALSKIEAGKSKHSRYLARIAQYLDIPLERIDPYLKGATVIHMADHGAAATRRSFKLYSSAEGGPGQIIMSSDPIDYIDPPAELAHVSDAYAFIVTGTSMEPEYRPGDTAYVHPHLAVIPNETYVFFSDREGEVVATIKHLRKVTPGEWHVLQHNPPRGKPKEFALSRNEWQRAHRVKGRFRP